MADDLVPRASRTRIRPRPRELQSAIRRIAREAKIPEREILVFVRGQRGDQTGEGWMVSVTLRTDLPKEAESHGYVGALRKYPLLVVQREHLDKLNGRTLSAKGGQLAVL